MKTMHALLASSLLVAGACQRPELETRTFALEHIPGHEAQTLVTPYVYADREGRWGGPGEIAATADALTVRETRDNLERIAGVLAELDRPRPDVRLRFQLIEADGAAGRDPRIADVEEELRRLFQFRGYRLLGEALVSAADRSEIMQDLLGGETRYRIHAEVMRAAPGTLRLQDVALVSADAEHLRTTMNVRIGQTIVLGSSPREGASSTLLLTVTAEEAGEGG
jgi:hypothetical protein